MKLFRVNIHTGEITFLKESIAAIKEFNAVLRKLRKVKGDSDGRDKKRNKKELLYIFYMSDCTGENPYHSFLDKERHFKAIEAAELPNDYIPDNLVIAACHKYEELQEEIAPTYKILLSLKRSMRQSSKYFEGLAEENENLMNAKNKLQVQLINSEGNDIVSVTDGLATINKLLQANIANAQKFTVNLESAIEKINKLEEKARFELATARKISGGGNLYNRESPQ